MKTTRKRSSATKKRKTARKKTHTTRRKKTGLSGTKKTSGLKKARMKRTLASLKTSIKHLEKELR